MNYLVRRTGLLTWEVEREDDYPYYVFFDIHKKQWICSCYFHEHVSGQIGKDCKHVRFAKLNLINGTEAFDNSKIYIIRKDK